MSIPHPAQDPDCRPLWAPWRINYILENRKGHCFFCEKAANVDDHENLIIARGHHSFLLLNAYPYNAGHVMVAPYSHSADITDIEPVVLHEMMDLVVRMKLVVSRLMSPQGFNFGFNLGVAGGTGVLDHLHGHLVPRWIGDTNFMPVISGTRVVPQALEETGRMLRETWETMFCAEPCTCIESDAVSAD